MKKFTLPETAVPPEISTLFFTAWVQFFARKRFSVFQYGSGGPGQEQQQAFNFGDPRDKYFVLERSPGGEWTLRSFQALEESAVGQVITDALTRFAAGDFGNDVAYQTTMRTKSFVTDSASVPHFMRLLGDQVHIDGQRRLGGSVLLDFSPAEGEDPSVMALFAPQTDIKVTLFVPGPIAGDLTQKIAAGMTETVGAICALALGRSVEVPLVVFPLTDEEDISSERSRRYDPAILGLARDGISLDVFNEFGALGGLDGMLRVRGALLSYHAALQQSSPDVALMLLVSSLEALIVPRAEWRKDKATKRFIVALDDLCAEVIDSLVNHVNVEQAFGYRKKGSAKARRRQLLDRIYALRSNPTHSGVGLSGAGMLSMFADSGTLRVALLSTLARGALLEFLQAPRSSLIGHPLFDQSDDAPSATTSIQELAGATGNDGSELLDLYSSAIGEALLAYVLAVDVSDLPTVKEGQQQLDQARLSVVDDLRQLTMLPIPQQPQEINRTELLRFLLMQCDEHGVSVARLLHRQAGATEPSVEDDDPLRQAVMRLAIDAFPAFLIPREEDFFPAPIGTSIYVTRLMFHHPGQRAFQEAAVTDATLSRLFTTAASAGPTHTMLSSNTGTDDEFSCFMYAETILNHAWWQVKDSAPTVESFISAVTSQLELVRDLVAGKTHPGTATFAFVGVLLPDGVNKVDLGNATLEATTAADRAMAPPGLKHQLTSTDPAGSTLVANYDGDIVLRQQFPFKVRLTKLPRPELIQQWPKGHGLPESLDRNAERLRLSLTIAVQRQARAIIVPTWRHFSSPFALAQTANSWSDPRHAVGIMPIKLTESELAAWVEWYKILSSPRMDQLGLVISRILRALGERKEPSDMLIDAVIAWENLFGSSQGEPTLRVTSSLAILLESDVARRKKLRTRLADIYTLRSDIVHGNRALRNDDHPLCNEALEIAIRAVRILAKERTDVLQRTDGGARSLYLILGGQSEQEYLEPGP